MQTSGMINLGLRAFQFIWTLLIMSLIGNMIANASGGSPSVVNYSMFVAVFSMLSLFYLIPATIREGFAISIIMLGLDLANTLFFFCGAIALAAELNVHSCSNQGYISSNHVINAARPGDRSKSCHEGQASCAFMWFGFVSYAASCVLSGLQARGSGGRGSKGKFTSLGIAENRLVHDRG